MNGSSVGFVEQYFLGVFACVQHAKIYDIGNQIKRHTSFTNYFVEHADWAHTNAMPGLMYVL